MRAPAFADYLRAYSDIVACEGLYVAHKVALIEELLDTLNTHELTASQKSAAEALSKNHWRKRNG